MKKYSLGARCVRAIYNLRRMLIHVVCTAWYKFVARVAGVEYGDGLSINGRIRIDRFKYSVIKIGDNCTFNSHNLFNPRGVKQCILYTATDFARLEIGNNCGFSGVSIVCWNNIKIGNKVMIGADTCIGDTDDHPERLGRETEPIEIRDNVFIGMHCIVLKGVTIGENSIIGAGSVVTKDIPANCVAAGVPCKVLRYLDK